ncbi:hypothetical protein QTI33_09610 [Variovorax sp. J22P271]|uniref:hypothetical protein n=1 Tax=Variovorax davisae TaxID=3053515 RepID=UPI002575FBD4|nr:hypothetical protein [Variovorax sp. J22P271]MDM0032380.1 hypothetical protein [Variovorax sp. J22P271]
MQGKEQCDLYWRRAQAWIGINSRFKLQTVSDTVLETFTPPEASPYYAFRIVREPKEADTDRIWVAVSCRNMFGCGPPSREGAMAAIKAYIRGDPAPAATAK